MKPSTRHVATTLAAVLAVLAAGPAYAEWVMVSTGVSGNSAAVVLAELGNRTGTIIDEAVLAGAGPLSVRMLDFDVSRAGNGWSAMQVFVLHAPNTPATAELLASYEDTTAYVLEEYGPAVPEPAELKVVQKAAYYTGDRLVLTANMLNVGGADIISVTLEELKIGSIILTQNSTLAGDGPVDDYGLLTLSGMTGNGPCTSTLEPGSTVDASGECAGATVTIVGLSMSPDDLYGVESGATTPFRIVIGGGDVAADGSKFSMPAGAWHSAGLTFQLRFQYEGGEDVTVPYQIVLR